LASISHLQEYSITIDVLFSFVTEFPWTCLISAETCRGVYTAK